MIIFKKKHARRDLAYIKGREFYLWGNLVAVTLRDIYVGEAVSTSMFSFEPGWGDTDSDRRATLMLMLAGRTSGLGVFK